MISMSSIIIQQKHIISHNDFRTWFEGVHLVRIEVLDASLCEDAHVELEAGEGEEREEEEGEDDDVAQSLDGVDHGVDDRLQSCGAQIGVVDIN